jgi:uncharacterized protein YdeI (YjbR/CyaY-like superfamily)
VPAKSFTVEPQRVQPSVYDGVGHVVVPRDIAAALAADPEAKKAFASMSPTHRREYVDWVEEAKRSETRARRIVSTVARVRGGKPRR